MDNIGLWQVAGLDAVINERLTESSICHDEFQINKAVGLHLMLHKYYLRIGNRTCESNEHRRKKTCSGAGHIWSFIVKFYRNGSCINRYGCNGSHMSLLVSGLVVMVHLWHFSEFCHANGSMPSEMLPRVLVRKPLVSPARM